jgi:hypothetical protein
MAGRILCTCGCGEHYSRKMVLRHLHGKGTKSVLIAQQNKLASQDFHQKINKNRKKRARDPDSVTQHADDLPIQPPCSDGPLDSSVAIHDDLLHSAPGDSPLNSPMDTVFPINDDLHPAGSKSSSNDTEHCHQTNSQLLQDLGSGAFLVMQMLIYHLQDQ